MKQETITYIRRGVIEISGGRSYHWVEGYSETSNGCICYPWVSKSQAKREAAAQGKRAVFRKDP